MTAPAATSIYSVLDEGKKEFRLLFLESNDRAEPIQCFTGTYSLRQPDLPSYEAVSYVWGYPNLCKTVILNGQECKITSNLFAVLRQLRRPSGQQNRTLWVDALCINQADLDERSSQVLLMRQIYTQSSLDIAFLDVCAGTGSGEGVRPDPAREDGLRLLKNIHGHDVALLQEMREEMETRSKSKYFNYKQAERESTSSGEAVKDDAPVYLLSRDQVSHLSRLFIAPLWSRMWIVQELVCAPNVLLVSGNEQMDWTVLSDLFGDRAYNDAFHGTWGHGETARPIFQHLFTQPLLIEHQRKAMAAEGTNPPTNVLLDILNRFIRLNATDPRDRIYGLLGLLPESHGIVPDYNKPVGDIFEEVTITTINMMANLDVICQSTFRVGSDMPPPIHPTAARRGRTWPPTRAMSTSFNRHYNTKTHSRSSWVPEYFDRSVNQLIFAQRGIFSAGRPSCEAPCHTASHLLRAKAILIDHIQADEVAFLDIISSLVRGDPNPHLSQPYPHPQTPACPHNTGESKLRALARTEIHDCTQPPRMRRMTMEEILAAEQEVLDRYAAYTRHGEIMPPWSSTENVHITSRGLYAQYGYGPRPGDVIAVLDGGKVPVVLRAVEPTSGDDDDGVDGPRYDFVCVAYLHGYMDGEAMNEVQNGQLQEQTVWLV